MTTAPRDQASRRTVLRAGMAALTGVAMAGAGIVTGERARAQTKIAQKLVQYIPVSKKPNQTCANCAQFVAPNSCKIVQGDIVPGGWCVSWTPAPKTAS